MTGNVSEWCDDGFDVAFYASLSPRARDPMRSTSGCENRVIRGGTFSSATNASRCAARSFAPASLSSPQIGFRVAAAR
jgi:formylglycine-generating enzyme required for sulfatase activity